MIPRAGADLQDLLIAIQFEQLGHQRHDVRLGDRLTGPYSERTVDVGLLLQVLGDEGVARDLAHGSNDIGVVHAPANDLILHHRLAMKAESIVLGMEDHDLTHRKDHCRQGPEPDQMTAMLHVPYVLHEDDFASDQQSYRSRSRGACSRVCP